MAIVALQTHLTSGPNPQHLRIGIVGLGVGTLTAYGNPGDYIRVYEINPEVTRVRGGFNVKLTTDKFAKAIYLSVADHDGFFSDNYFNLAPGKELTVEFRSREPLTLEQFKERLQIRSVFDAF